MSLEWETYTVEELVNKKMLDKPLDGNHGGIHPKSTDYVDEGVPFIMANDLKDGSIDYNNCKYISEEQSKTLKKGFSKPGDVLLTHKATIGRTAIVDSIHDTVILTPQVTYYRVLNGINNYYLYFYFNSIYFQNILKNWSSSGSTRQYIGISSQLKLPIILPPLEIQNNIADILLSIENKINVNKKINKNLLSIADAIFKKEFRNFDEYLEGDLISSDFGLIPKNWYYKTLDEISDVAIGKTPPRKETWWFSEKEGVKWVSIKDLGNSGTYIFETSEYLTEEAIDKFNVKLIPEDTVILSFKLTVGRLGITTDEMTTNEAIAHFKLDSESPISKEYLYLYLKNFNYDELGSTSSIAKAINSKIVKKIPILVPESNKLNEFKELFENIFNEIKSNQIEINNLTKLRDTLLPKLMSGEIDVSKINCDFENIAHFRIFSFKKIIGYLGLYFIRFL